MRVGKVDDYLCIEPYLRDFVVAQALNVALRKGLIDVVAELGRVSQSTLAMRLATDQAGVGLLCEVLKSAGVLRGDTQQLCLSDGFKQALVYRELMEAKLDFANLLAPDLIAHFQAYVDDFGLFMARSRVFDLFRYDRCYESTPDNIAKTRKWMRFTTMLTRYEAPVCLQHHDFSRYRSLLDVGGNSGEFVQCLCRAHPLLRADVLDLPVVCDIGREHIQHSDEAQRIRFIPGDAVEEALPQGYDAISFKSMLHDWPEEIVALFLEKAVKALEPDGTLIIFERGPLDLAPAASNYGLLPMLLFFRNFRPPSVYAEILKRLGMAEIEITLLALDTPFFILSARRV